MRQKLRRWRKGEEGEEKYRKERRKYREMCRRKKREEGERLIREAGEARTESKVWEIVNRERRKIPLIRKWAWEICNRVWREKEWTEGGWKERIIALIVKKGEGDKIADYRGVTLTLYKIYTSILTERLREETEKKILYRKIRQDLEREKR